MSNQWSILIVEDDENLGNSTITSLRRDGYYVQGALSGTDAVRLLWTESYHVVVCDLKRPEDNVAELLKWIRVYRPHIRVIVVGSAISRAQALESGAVSYIAHPLNLHQLKEELRRLFQQTGFSASLDSFDLLDVIQIITLSRKTIALVVNTGLEERGVLLFQEGELVWAEYGVLLGEEAFFALAAHKNGTVIHQPWNERIQPNVTQPLSRLIFQALQYREKYAAYQQSSGEQVAVSTGPITHSPLDDPIDDSPFVFSGEPPLAEEKHSSPSSALEELLLQGVHSSAAYEERQQDPSVFAATSQSQPIEAREETKEWWQESKKHSSLQQSNGLSPLTGDALPMAAEPQKETVNGNTPDKSAASMPTATTSERIDLPAWLIDQPTQFEMPVLRPSSLTGTTFVPTVPNSETSSAHSSMRASNKTASSEWEAVTPKTPVPSRKTGSMPRRNTMPVAKIRTAFRKTASPEWQPPDEPPKSGLLQMEEGQNLEVGRGRNRPLPGDSQEHTTPKLKKINGAQQPSKRNYPGLVAALQELGYSTPGFVATAVVSMDGRPIAQVAVDERDISSMCGHLGIHLQSATRALSSGTWGYLEDTSITTSAYHILLRNIRSDSDAFHVVIVTREAGSVESLTIMKNAEEAIRAAL